MTIAALIEQINTAPESVDYRDVLALIASRYHYQPTAFINGELSNQAGENEVSCQIFAFSQLHNLSKEQALACFGQLYFQEVLQHPEAQGHKNIRQFMLTGWQGIRFERQPLQSKAK